MAHNIGLEDLEPEKLDLASLDIAAEKRAELLRLFPEVRTEGGKIDFDRLRLALGDTVDVGKERYGMNWPGKADCFKAIQRPSLGTLRPVREESVNFDETENLIIEGDNLEVLKLLQKAYQGKVKMIYIDPPYNTGNDFIYPDNYSENLQTYLEYTGQVDSEGRRFSNNTETSGRFHSRWLSMMYPRLFLARNLLTENGLVFVSINDVEFANLMSLCNEIFGEENHFATFIWTNEGNIDNQSRIKVNHEYVVAYAKSEESIQAPPVIDPNVPETSKLFRDFIENTIVKNGPANPVSPIELPVGFPAGFESGDIEPKENFWPRLSNRVSVVSGATTNAVTVSSGWSSKDIAEQFIRGGFKPVKDIKGQETIFFISKSGAIFSRKVRHDSQSHVLSVLRGMGTVQAAAADLDDLGIAFQYPKPKELIEFLVKVGSDEGDIVLDFFAGSGTLGEAVLNINAGGGNRSFILVQLPERTKTQENDGTWLESPAFTAGFESIADITKERVRRVIQRHAQEAECKLNLANQPKEGFRILKLATSNFNVWNASTESTTPDALAQQLTLQIDHIQPGRTSEDLLYEILLKSGFPPTTPIETLTIEGKSVYSVTGYGMLICLERGLTHELIRAIAERKPGHVVCLDEGFAGNDQLKTNAVLIMKSKGVTKFQTI